MFRLKKKPSQSAGKPRISSLMHLFHGVEIVPGQRACDAVHGLANRRLLSEDAPRLPLNTCSDPRDCTCKYKHYVDRRTDARRESDEGLPARGYPTDKRDGSGRRITDR